MEIGTHLPCHGPLATRKVLIRLAKRLEELGYDSLWASNHVVLPYDLPPYPYVPNIWEPYSGTGTPLPAVEIAMLEPTTTLGLLSAVTDRVRLGTTTVVLPTRHPVLFAKTLATLDHLSQGRLILGAGVGWIPSEIAIFGVPFEERGQFTDEAIRVMRACWEGRRVRYKGRYVSFDDVAVLPQPTRGHIPIWIGGNSGRAMRRVAELGDGWHPAYLSPAQVRDGIQRLLEECRHYGRAFEELTMSVRLQVEIHESPLGNGRKLMQGAPEEIVSDLTEYREAGVDVVILDAQGQERDDEDAVLRTLERFAEEIRPEV